MRKFFVFTIIALAIAPVLSAQTQAVVKEISGKVEVKTGSADWQPAKAGMKFDTGASISTGFNSTAVLDLGTSILTVRPLTRLQLAELIKREASVSTTLVLRVGKVKAEVKKVEGVRQDFTLRSAQATASVRGTLFEFDGVSVQVTDGLVVFTNSLGQGVGVSGGEKSSTNGAGSSAPTTGEQEMEDAAVVDSNPAPVDTGTPPEPEKPATVVITWR